MLSFDAVVYGGPQELQSALRACKDNGVTVLSQDDKTPGVFKLRAQTEDANGLETAVREANFALVLFA
jgi:hypothetical protein